jgi:hypothetical protein
MFRTISRLRTSAPGLRGGLTPHHHRADDAPPYFTIVIVGHIAVGLLLAVEMAYRPPLRLHAVRPARTPDPALEEEKIETFDAALGNDRGR